MKKKAPTLIEVIAKTNTGYISYSDLLHTKEWQDKRVEIIKRDNNHCTNCGKQETITDTDDYGFRRKTYHFWYGNEKNVITNSQTGSYDSIPEIIYSDKPYWMEVHHTYYILDKLPWEYDDKALVTLCNWCHRDLHQSEVIEVYQTENDPNTLHLEPCQRCNGEGWLPEYEHIQSGICFSCRGTKYSLPLIKV